MTVVADRQTAEQADWLIGAEIFTPGVGADALRSMKAPGTAYDSPLFGAGTDYYRLAL